MAEDGLRIMDLFYPKTLAHPELDNVWTTHAIKRHGRSITLQDKRTLVGNIVQDEISPFFTSFRDMNSSLDVLGIEFGPIDPSLSESKSRTTGI
jgi:hypothetical protein